MSCRLIRIEDAQPVGGFCFSVRLPFSRFGDTVEQPFASTLQLIEDGVGFGRPHSLHDTIQNKGGGAFSHWHDTLYFSTTDNSDPRENGRIYHALLPEMELGPAGHAIELLKGLDVPFKAEQAYTVLERCAVYLCPEAKLGEWGKSYWYDEAFLSSYESLCGANYRALERKFAVFQLISSLDWLEGDVAECGAYNGSTAFFLARANEATGNRRHIFLYDSFDGLSTPSVEDGDYWRAGDLASTEAIARQNLAQFSNVHLRKGWIPDRFSEVADREFCFVHVDVDLYRPTHDSISFFYPRLRAGGMLVCDDYGFSTCPGARKAMDEFFADKPEQIVHLPTGQALVIKLPS